jgi:Ca2+-binding RTX toxin-like protein
VRRGAATFLIAGAVAVLGLVPASAQAGLHVTYDAAHNGDLVLRADYSDYVNKLALATVTPSGGSTDLVVGDVAAGIADPLPSFCPRVDPTIIRCPLSMIHEVNIDLGRGNDTLSASSFEKAVAAYWRVAWKANLGPGNDVAVGAPGPNVIFGGPGRDLIEGGPLFDKLYGGAGNDFLVGNEGNDLFQCGKGPQDLFNDGPGKDLVNIRTCERRVHREFVP